MAKSEANGITKKLKENLITAIVAVPGLLVSLIIADVIPLLHLEKSPLFTNSILLKLLGLLFYFLVLCVALLIDGRKGKLKVKFGTKWDKDLNPHCPTCETPLSQYQITEGGGRFGSASSVTKATMSMFMTMKVCSSI